jgi:tetratricopeptide (TPR) repeat protein
MERRPSSCALTALERSVLRFHRLGDVPGLEIPSRYFQFLRTGDVSVIAGVLDHNRHDIVSLAAVTAHALRLAAGGPDACECATERLGLGRLYERAGELERAEQAFALAAASDEGDVAAQALARLAVLLRRQGRHGESARAWQGVLDLGGSPETLERRAVEALAIHHEHRARDLAGAKRYAETLNRRAAGGSQARDAARRLARLERKLRKSDAPTLLS